METSDPVLIADGDSISRAALARVLENAGYGVLQATTGDEAETPKKTTKKKKKKRRRG